MCVFLPLFGNISIRRWDANARRKEGGEDLISMFTKGGSVEFRHKRTRDENEGETWTLDNVWSSRVCTWSRTWTVRTLWIQSKSTQFQRVCVCVSPKNGKKKKKETVPFRIVIFDGVNSFLPSLFLWFLFFFSIPSLRVIFSSFFPIKQTSLKFYSYSSWKIFKSWKVFWNRVCDFLDIASLKFLKLLRLKCNFERVCKSIYTRNVY